MGVSKITQRIQATCRFVERISSVWKNLHGCHACCIAAEWILQSHHHASLRKHRNAFAALSQQAEQRWPATNEKQNHTARTAHSASNLTCLPWNIRIHSMRCKYCQAICSQQDTVRIFPSYCWRRILARRLCWDHRWNSRCWDQCLRWRCPKNNERHCSFASLDSQKAHRVRYLTSQEPELEELEWGEWMGLNRWSCKFHRPPHRNMVIPKPLPKKGVPRWEIGCEHHDTIRCHWQNNCKNRLNPWKYHPLQHRASTTLAFHLAIPLEVQECWVQWHLSNCNLQSNWVLPHRVQGRRERDFHWSMDRSRAQRQ